MATLKQIAASRANAKLSTGPRTQAGKSHSRLNSWKHGLTARKILVNGESPEDFEALRGDLYREHDPQTATECELVEFITAQFWRLRRGAEFEASLLNQDRSVNQVPPRPLQMRVRYVAGGPDPDRETAPDPSQPKRGDVVSEEVIEIPEPAFAQKSCSSETLTLSRLEPVDRHQTSLLNGLIKALQLLYLIQSRRVGIE